MAKSNEPKEQSLLEKAMSHKVKRQMKTAVNKDTLAVYVAFFNGTIDASQACFALGVTQSTFRGNSGTVLRDAIVRGLVNEITYAE